MTNKTDSHDITKLLLKLALNTITLTLKVKGDLDNCTPLLQLSLFGNGWAKRLFLDKAAVHVNNNM